MPEHFFALHMWLKDRGWSPDDADALVRCIVEDDLERATTIIQRNKKYTLTRDCVKYRVFRSENDVLPSYKMLELMSRAHLLDVQDVVHLHVMITKDSSDLRKYWDLFPILIENMILRLPEITINILRESNTAARHFIISLVDRPAKIQEEYGQLLRRSARNLFFCDQLKDHLAGIIGVLYHIDRATIEPYLPENYTDELLSPTSMMLYGHIPSSFPTSKGCSYDYWLTFTILVGWNDALLQKIYDSDSCTFSTIGQIELIRENPKRFLQMISSTQCHRIMNNIKHSFAVRVALMHMFLQPRGMSGHNIFEFICRHLCKNKFPDDPKPCDIKLQVDHLRQGYFHLELLRCFNEVTVENDKKTQEEA